MKLLNALFVATVLCFVGATAQASDKILEINEDWMPVCYYGDAKKAMQELLSLDFDPSLSAEDAEIKNGVLIAPQYDENGSTQQVVEVPKCDGEPTDDVQDEENFSNEISFSCFETMSGIFENAKGVSKSASKDVMAVIAKAEADAKTRVNATQKGVAPISKVTMNGKELTGIKVTFETSDDDEYGNYFLYSYDNYGKGSLQLLSAHYSDDQGPEVKIFCQGWSEGKEIK